MLFIARSHSVYFFVENMVTTAPHFILILPVGCTLISSTVSSGRKNKPKNRQGLKLTHTRDGDCSAAFTYTCSSIISQVWNVCCRLFPSQWLKNALHMMLETAAMPPCVHWFNLFMLRFMARRVIGYPGYLFPHRRGQFVSCRSFLPTNRPLSLKFKAILENLQKHYYISFIWKSTGQNFSNECESDLRSNEHNRLKQ